MTATTQRISTLEHAGLSFDVFDEGPLEGDDRVGGPVHLVGHDWGAVVAWAVAIRRPDLLRTLTAISVPHPMAYLSASVTSRQFLRSWYILFLQLPRLPELAASRAGGPIERSLRRAGMTPEEIARFRTEMVDDGAFAPARAGAEKTGRYVDGPYDFVTLEGVSHWIPTQAPEACADAILARVSG